MARALLLRGLLAGAVAGVVAFVFAYFVGEPHVQAAIDFEESLASGHGEHEVVTRGVQRTLGLLTGTVVLGVALGGLFSMLFGAAYGRVGRLGARATALWLALGAFVTIALIPATKYPANPPATGDPATIDRRTLLFLVMIACSILCVVAALRIRRALLPRLGAWNATLAAAGIALAVLALAEVMLPAVSEIPRGFPADTLWAFRLSSLGTSLIMWTGIGVGFGVLAERLVAARREVPGSVPAPA